MSNNKAKDYTARPEMDAEFGCFGCAFLNEAGTCNLELDEARLLRGDIHYTHGVCYCDNTIYVLKG